MNNNILVEESGTHSDQLAKVSAKKERTYQAFTNIKTALVWATHKCMRGSDISKMANKMSTVMNVLGDPQSAELRNTSQMWMQLIRDIIESPFMSYWRVWTLVTVQFSPFSLKVWIWDMCQPSLWQNCFQLTKKKIRFQLHKILIVSRTKPFWRYS